MRRLLRLVVWVGLALLAWPYIRSFYLLLTRDARRTLVEQPNEGPPGLRVIDTRETEHYTVRHVIEDGIERITYTPRQRRHDTPILMQHGMFHGAWCWAEWQALFAEWGWESHAISLPGHAGSPVQRPINDCTLDYYLSFLKREVDRLPVKPVLMGHSMGGALTQWYLKYVGDDLPAAVPVAAWPSHSSMASIMIDFWNMDSAAVLLSYVQRNANSWIRTPEAAAQKFISEGALLTPEALHAKLGPESALVTLQHNPPLWTPPHNLKTPMLWVAAEQDTVIKEYAARASADHYGADYLLVQDAAHDLMIEHNYRDTAEKINTWLNAKGIA